MTKHTLLLWETDEGLRVLAAVVGGRCPFDDWFKGLEKREKQKIMARTATFSKGLWAVPPNISDWIDPLKGIPQQLFEFRFTPKRAKGPGLRGVFADHVPSRAEPLMIFMTGFRKKDGSIPASEKTKAVSVYTRWKKESEK